MNFTAKVVEMRMRGEISTLKLLEELKCEHPKVANQFNTWLKSNIETTAMCETRKRIKTSLIAYPPIPEQFNKLAELIKEANI